MYKVILVEDEPMIREGLRTTTPWADYGCQVVGEASDAVEAELLILQMKPDIVITDIRMPGVSGLQLIERVKGSVSCEFIIISGYDQFEYAQKAVYLGVKGYLLKPIDDRELKDVIERAVESLRRAGHREQPPPGDGLLADIDARERYLSKARVMMEKRCNEELTLKMVADELGISESYLGKLFKSHTEYTFLELLTMYRMKKAVRMLTETDCKVYEIAVETGYRDAKYFSNVFRKIVGVTPRAFKNGRRLSAGHILNQL